MYTLKTDAKKIIADTITPVSIYLKLRDQFPHSLLLESSDYHANKNSFSYICCNPVASIRVQNEEILEEYPDGTSKTTKISSEVNLPEKIQDFAVWVTRENWLKTAIQNDKVISLSPNIWVVLENIISLKSRLTGFQPKGGCYNIKLLTRW